eukprot:snap_masked-scaffold_14-processed-gene-10.42-mRNA-1 protein AED:1.00 eAED:1.00 QI:0/0/0/0/1/1/3/0/66
MRVEGSPKRTSSLDVFYAFTQRNHVGVAFILTTDKGKHPIKRLFYVLGTVEKKSYLCFWAINAEIN